MEFKLKFPSFGKDVSKKNIASLSYESDLFNMYSFATITLDSFAEETFNNIKLGMEAIITFYDDQGISNNEYENHMRVLSFKKNPGQEQLNDSLDLTLVSSWYFNNEIKTIARVGTVSGIIEEIINELNLNGVSSDIETTSDPGKVRYQIAERDQDFINKLLSHGQRDGLPVYLFTDAKGTIRLRGLSGILTKEAEATLLPQSAQDKNNIPAGDYSSKKYKLETFRFVSDGSHASSKISTNFTTGHFVSSNKITTHTELKSAEIGNSQSEVSTPEICNFLGWEYTPDDALAYASKHNFEQNSNTFYLLANLPDFIEDIDVGSKLRVLLPYAPIYNSNGKLTNLGEGNYLVKTLVYSYKDNIKKTKLRLIQTTYK